MAKYLQNIKIYGTYLQRQTIILDCSQLILSQTLPLKTRIRFFEANFARSSSVHSISSDSKRAANNTGYLDTSSNPSGVLKCLICCIRLLEIRLALICTPPKCLIQKIWRNKAKTNRDTKWKKPFKSYSQFNSTEVCTNANMINSSYFSYVVDMC